LNNLKKIVVCAIIILSTFILSITLLVFFNKNNNVIIHENNNPKEIENQKETENQKKVASLKFDLKVEVEDNKVKINNLSEINNEYNYKLEKSLNENFEQFHTQEGNGSEFEDIIEDKTKIYYYRLIAEHNGTNKKEYSNIVKIKFNITEEQQENEVEEDSEVEYIIEYKETNELIKNNTQEKTNNEKTENSKTTNNNISNTSVIENKKRIPTIEKITGNPINWTNKDVTLKIEGVKDNGVGLADKPYSFDGGKTWQSSNEKTYSKNTSNIYVKVRDKLGNIYSHPKIEIKKIDKTSPTIEKITGNPINWTNKDVTLKIVGAKDNGVGLADKPYSFDGGKTWQTSNEKKYSKNISNISIKVRDKLGNIYTHPKIEIKEIDKTSPTIGKITGNPTSWTYNDVTLKIEGAKDAGIGLADKPYSFDGGKTWQTSSEKTYSKNTSNISIKVRDKKNNVYTHSQMIHITKIKKEVEFHFINPNSRVDAVLIKVDGKSIFIDGGFYKDAKMEIEYIKNEGISKLDYYIGTHAHTNHIGATSPILVAMKPDVVYLSPAKYKEKENFCYKKILETAKTSTEKNTVKEYYNQGKMKTLTKGENLKVGNLEIKCVGPLTPNHKASYDGQNRNSLILRLDYGKNSFLLAGDTYYTELLDSNKVYPNCIDVDVYKNSHHNATHNVDTLKKISPKYVVFTTRYDYLPSNSYLQSIKSVGATPYIATSNRDGHVMIKSDGEKLTVYTNYNHK